jgi:hypothetical protein
MADSFGRLTCDKRRDRTGLDDSDETTDQKVGGGAKRGAKPDRSLADAPVRPWRPYPFRPAHRLSPTDCYGRTGVIWVQEVGGSNPPSPTGVARQSANPRSMSVLTDCIDPLWSSRT